MTRFALALGCAFAGLLPAPAAAQDLNNPAPANHTARPLNAAIHLATAAQTGELGSIFVVNLGQ